MTRKAVTQKTVKAVKKSGDRKLSDPKKSGPPVAATWAPQQTCPGTCPFRGSGCYAESGNCRMHTTKLNEAAARLPARGRKLTLAQHEAAAIDALPADGRPLRLHVVGDCSTKRSAETVAAAAERYMQRGGGAVWTYTHAWRTVPRASWGAVSVLASVESAADAAAAHSRGYAAAAVADTVSGKGAQDIGAGMLGIPCPHATGTAPDCARCRLCARADALHSRRGVVLLAVIGQQHAAVRDALPADAIGRGA